MATTSGPISLQPCSYWKEGSGSLRLSGGCGNWLGVSNHPTHTHAHTNSNTYAQIMQQNAQTFFFYLELNVMARILILVQTGLNFCGLDRHIGIQIVLRKENEIFVCGSRLYSAKINN